MIILVDMDDTIEHLLKAWVNGVNEKYGRCVSCDEIVVNVNEKVSQALMNI